ncbi:uncharacterized protein LOC103374843 [Tachysurus ichikawai]
MTHVLSNSEKPIRCSLRRKVNNLQTKYDIFERSMEETASELLGKLRKPKAKHWVSKATTSILEKRNQAKKAFRSSRLERDKEIWQNLNQELESAYANDQVQHLQGKLQQLKSAAASGHLRTTWEIVNELGGKNMSKHQHKMKRADGSSINNKKDLRDEWSNYVRDLLNVHSNLSNTDSILPAPSDLDIKVGPITYQETFDAVQQLKNGKAPGCAVLVEGELTDEFDITTGVLQGDTLAPFLFIIVIDYVLKNTELNHARSHGINKGENGFVTQPRQLRRELAIAIFDLDFADDLALLEGNLERAQSQLNETAKQAEQVGLMVIVKKTEAFTNQDKSKNLKLGSQRIE